MTIRTRHGAHVVDRTGPVLATWQPPAEHDAVDRNMTWAVVPSILEVDATVSEAAELCPVSRLFAGADITVNATLLEDQADVAEGRRTRSVT